MDEVVKFRFIAHVVPGASAVQSVSVLSAG